MEMDSALYTMLPKTDLHLHLDGAARPDTLREFALAKGLSPEQIEPYLKVRPSSLAEYLSHFRFVLPLMQSRAALERIAYEVIEDAAAHTAAYAEIRFCPLLHLEGGLSGEEAVDAVLAGIARVQEDLGGVLGRVILCVIQGMEAEQAERIVDLALNFQISGVVGVDVAGDESAQFRIEPFVPAFKRARDAGLRITCHAGETGDPDHIIQAIELLGANRIGHGTAILKDPRAIQLALDHNVGIECCITSNWQTGSIKEIADHPLRKMLAHGLSATINTDNPTFSDTDIELEWQIATDALGLTSTECAQILANGFANMFLEDAPAPVRNQT